MFCGAVHIWPVYSDSENATLRATAFMSDALSTMIWFTPAFSVYTCACRACSSSQRPLAVLPVKSMMRTSGRSASCCATVAARFVGEQRDDVGIDARLGQHLARDLHRDRERQDRARMRLHDHRVAGREAREHPRVAVPGRERAAADDEPDAARHDAEVLLHADRLVLALRLLPLRRCAARATARPTRTRPLRGRGPAHAGRPPGTPS